MDRNISVLRVKSFFESQIVEATKYYHEKLSREDLPFEERTLYQGALKALQILKRNYAIIKKKLCNIFSRNISYSSR